MVVAAAAAAFAVSFAGQALLGGGDEPVSRTLPASQVQSLDGVPGVPASPEDEDQLVEPGIPSEERRNGAPPWGGPDRGPWGGGFGP
ncbi:hypothetical protein [Conexibacter sp. SYSU D00693]|uniref:hypothetical protein n=1 Tax=Conexibacter sp. SYSU D00693 TaxID=2812560 RepID=UPI00196A24C2|nr:hypothetical protein [Conexibacter sp. SYSU D00693]